jgi:LuxR family maltose regulon positive regulatory protein
LSTKLAPPHLRPPVVKRRRLLDRLDQGLAHKLTLLSAPAGFGKTTLAAEWVETGDWETGKLGTGKPTSQPPNLPVSHPTNLPIYHVAWVSLDAGDNDPVRFWRYVVSACGAFDPGIGDSSLALLQTSQQPAFEAVLTAFINELAGLPGKCVLILEDYHLITARPVHETLTFWLDYLPPALHVVMLTRGDPPLPLARLRARNELNELRAADLRFSPEETRDFLRLAVPFALPAGAVERLAARTEGWPAGLRLVALALQRRRSPEEIETFLATFTGGHRPILDYLVADVLGAQPEPVQEFLLQTAFLSRLTGPLCDAVYQSTNFPISQSTNLPTSQAILEHLERANLFVIPLDDRREWYRYHTLFAEAMQHHARQRLGEARLRELSRRASLWYAGHGLLGEAVEAALAARDYPQAADLVERIVAPELVHNEYHTLRRWMEQLPEEVLRLHPRLCFTYAVAILFTSVRHAAATRALLQTPLDMAEQAWQAAGDRPRLGEVVAFRSLVAWLQREYARSFSLARQSLELLPGDEAQWRGIALIMAGVEELWAGELNAARPTLTQARALCQAAGNLYGTLDTTLILGDLCVWQGDLGQAGGLYRQALSTAEQAPIDRDQALQRRGRALAGLAGLALELNDREAAGRDAAEALDIGRQLADEELLVRASLVLARLELARGEAGPARERLHALAAQTHQPPLLREVHAWQARLALAAGDLAAARRWAAASVQSGDDLPRIRQEAEALVVARVLLAQGEAEAALRLAGEWEADARAHGRSGRELEIHLLQALAHAALGWPARAGQALVRALELAQPEGYRRVFLDEGEPLARLLGAVLPELGDEPLLRYARALLLDFAGERSPAEPAAAPVPGLLVEPLSPQELRVLRLAVAGLSNPEIAGELVVSVNTVKTHLKNVYRKLNVANRHEAGDAARDLKLL